MRGHLCERETDKDREGDMSLHKAHSTGTDHTLQHVNRKTQARGEGGVLE